MNGYELSKAFYNFSANNIGTIKPIHGMLYFYIIDLNNRLDWVERISLPSYHTMSIIGVSSYKTYKNALEDLVEFKLIKLIQKSKNQHTACVVALVKNTKPHTKASTKAHTEADAKQSCSTVVITKPINNTKQDDDVKISPPSTSFFSISECRLKYDTDFVPTKLALCDKHSIAHKLLVIFQNEFDNELLATGKTQKVLTDYIDHFAKWINLKGPDGRSKILSEHYKQKEANVDFTEKYRK